MASGGTPTRPEPPCRGTPTEHGRRLRASAASRGSRDPTGCAQLAGEWSLTQSSIEPLNRLEQFSALAGVDLRRSIEFDETREPLTVVEHGPIAGVEIRLTEH